MALSRNALLSTQEMDLHGYNPFSILGYHFSFVCSENVSFKIIINFKNKLKFVDKFRDKSPVDWKFIAGSAHPTEENPSVEVRLVDKFLPHPSYKFRTILADYDVMLIRLSKPLELNVNPVPLGSAQPKLAAICLPDSSPEPGSWCQTAGWGYTTPGGMPNA